MNDNPAVVEVEHLTKIFGVSTALDDVSLNLSPGKIVGLLGSNGAGKSTLMRHLIGLYLPDSGQCRTFGCRSDSLGAAQLTRIGYVHQEGELIEWMTVAQLIRYVKSYYPTWNTDLQEQLIEDFAIVQNRRIGGLSPGDRQKVSILIAVCFEPELLILDEPAAALDPTARARFLDLLMKMIQEPNRTIIVSSHILSDVEKVIDHVIMMKSGRIIRDCSFDDLREEFYRVRLASLNGALPSNLSFLDVIKLEQNERQALLTIRSSQIPEIENFAEQFHCQIETEYLPLEDIYQIVMSNKFQAKRGV